MTITDLSDDAQEQFGVASGLIPMWTGARLAGPALNVWTRPGDNRYIHHALDLAQPGDVIVIHRSQSVLMPTTT